MSAERSDDARLVRPDGLAVRGRRHLRGWSPRDLVEAIGDAQQRATGLRETISPSELASVEERRVRVPYATVRLIAAGLDCNPVELLADAEESSEVEPGALRLPPAGGRGPSTGPAGWPIQGAVPRRVEVDSELPPAVLPVAVLNEVFAHAREAEPEECCGLILGDESVRHRQVVRCRNDMTLYHQRDPEIHPRDGREAFYMNELDYLRAAREAEARGQHVTGVYHSHVGFGVYFSELDQEYAAQPLFPFPDADHLVVSVIGGQVVGQALFRREPGPGPFVGRPVVHGRS